MKQAPFRLLLAAALTASVATSSSAFAQGKGKDKKPASADVEDLGGDDTTPPPSKDKDTTKPSSGSAGGDSAGLGGGSSFLCEENPEACDTSSLIKKFSEKELKDSQVYAVQQIYALRRGRFEFQPYYSASLNDQYVSHNAEGAAVNYYVSNVFAVGLNFNYFQNSIADFNTLVRESTRLAIPINQYEWGANLNFTYVPLYGKFAGFGDFIFHWDGYIVGGIGAIATRPYATIDPENRGFKYKEKVAFNAGVGFRVFFNRWFAAFLEVRDYIYDEDLENTSQATTSSNPAYAGDPAKDPSQWYGDSKLTNAVQAQFGISIFLPVSWQYKLPK